MANHSKKKRITPEIFREAIRGSVQKLNPQYMMKNSIMFVVEIGCFIMVLLSIFPDLFRGSSGGQRAITSSSPSSCL